MVTSSRTPTPEHRANMKSLLHKQQVVKDDVRQVCLGLSNGCLIYGKGGTGKSFLVLNELRACDATVVLHNTRLTPKGLFLALRDNPDAVHLFEDLESITRDTITQNLLRAALHAQPDEPRVVHWKTAAGGDPVVFTGGIVMTANQPLDNSPVLQAVATRIAVQHYQPTDAEIEALMWDLAWRGDGDLTPAECGMVTDHLIQECRAAGWPLDLRLQGKAFNKYRQHKLGQAGVNWQDRINIEVTQHVSEFHHEVDTGPRPKLTKAERQEVVRDLYAQKIPSAKREEEFTKITGLSEKTYHRVLQEMKAENQL